MFKKSSIKRLTIALVVLMLVLVVALSACTSAKPFQQRTLPGKATPVGNGGAAVVYGEWLYYINGNIASPDSANNAYTEDLRSGSIVRIKLSDLEDNVLSVYDLDMTTSEKSKEIENRIRKHAQMVVPNVYYNGNTDANLYGLYIFNDRIYITTPNDQLDSKGNVLTSQLVLRSYNLGGGDRQTHLVFETNAPQLKLSQVGNDVYATYVLDSKLMSYKVGDKEPATIAESISSQQFSGQYVHYLDSDGNICRYQVGAKEAVKLVPLVQPENHEEHNHKSYTIQKTNNEYVYYTISDSSSFGEAEASSLVLFYANQPVEDDNHESIIGAIPSGTYFCYGSKVIYTVDAHNLPDKSMQPPADQTWYNIVVAEGGSFDYEWYCESGASISLIKLDGSILYYTKSQVTYTLDLDGEKSQKAVPYAYGYSVSSSYDVLQVGEGADMVTYMFSLSNDAISLVKFNPETKKNVVSTTYITLVEKSDK